MRICAFGAGAVGGFLATKFALAGQQVTVIDRAEHLVAIKNNGIKVRCPDSPILHSSVKAVGTAKDAGKQNLVLLAVKAHTLGEIASDLHHLLDDKTMLMTLQNGIPWWYFEKEKGRVAGKRLKSIDPDGTLAQSIDANRLVACVVHPATQVVSPGVIKHLDGDRYAIGELDGQITKRLMQVRDVFAVAGLRPRLQRDIRSEIWFKALGAIALNPLSAITRATVVDICQCPETRQLAVRLMEEAKMVAEKLDMAFRLPIQKRVEGAEALGPHKTSMLQDVVAPRVYHP